MNRCRQYNDLCLLEILNFAADTFTANKVRFVLTAFGMVVGTASLILVVTIGLTGKQYVLRQIQSIGANMIYAEYAGGGQRITHVLQDALTIEDMRAVQQQVMGIKAASPMVELKERVAVGEGRERDIMILGVSPEYQAIRNLEILAGRPLDEQDTQAHSKALLMQQQLAKLLYGSQDAAIGQTIRITGLPFVVIGTFKERVETFGQSEIANDTVLIPYTVARYFTGTDNVKQLFFSTISASDVPGATEQIQRVLQSRHRPGSIYRAENLTELLSVAGKTANALTAVLLLNATVTLLVSGVGIMNIMLATVSARIREIGIRKAVGATNRQIKFQFLAEALFISLAGGIVGTAIGLLLPLVVRWFTEYRVPVSGLSVIIAILVSLLVGVLFGTVPAARAANLDPIESLRHE